MIKKDLSKSSKERGLMNNPVRPYVLCPECGSGSKRVHTDKDVEDAVKDMDDYIKAVTMYNLKRQWICSECSYVFELSEIDIMRIFALKRKLDGQTEKEINNEIKEKLDESKKRYRIMGDR